MKKLCVTSLILMLMSHEACASHLDAILDGIRKVAAIQPQMLGVQNNILGMQNNIYGQQLELNRLMRQVHGYISGHSGWGTYNFHDYQTWGKDAADWTQVLQLAGQGKGSGELGQAINRINHEFPSSYARYNAGIKNADSQRYYALKSRTTMAVRASSELDYNKIQLQIAYQQMLQQQIENTRDLKAAIDLSNRIQIEGNLIALQMLRQSAIANQQKAINEQGALVATLANARFLAKNQE